MPTQPFTSSRFRALDSNGVPLAGGLLYTYAAGTTTPLATYTDYVGGTPNANPVVLDSTGEADVWLLSGVLYKFVLKNSLGVTQYTTDNYPSSGTAGGSTDVAVNAPGGRLSLTTGTPVTTGDVTGATTIYYVPYVNDRVPLFDGTNWALFSIGTGLSQATTDNTKSPLAVGTNSNYDLFVWNDSGTVRLSRGPLWTSDTARGSGAGTTELQQVNGRWVNKNSITNGPSAQLGLYVGTVRSDGSSQINDSLTKRHVWNAHNRVLRVMRVQDTTASWTYSTNTWRQARATASNQLDYVCGLAEDAVVARVAVMAADSTGGNFPEVSIGIDSTTTPGSTFGAVAQTSGTLRVAASGGYTGIPGLGRHALVWLELDNTPAGTTTWFGAVSGSAIQSGIEGTIPA